MLRCGAYLTPKKEVVYIKDYKGGMFVTDTQSGEECISTEAIMNRCLISITSYDIVDMMRAEIRELKENDSNKERIGKLCFLDRVLDRFNLRTGDINMGEVLRQIKSLPLSEKRTGSG